MARLTFAQQYVQYDVNWQNVIFTDKKTFTSVAATARHCWRMPNTRYDDINICDRARNGRVSVSFHGWMWAAGPGELVTIKGHLNAQRIYKYFGDRSYPLSEHTPSQNRET